MMMMMIKKIEMCIQLVKLAYEFLMAVVEAVDYVMHHTNPSQPAISYSNPYPNIYIGLLP